LGDYREIAREKILALTCPMVERLHQRNRQLAGWNAPHRILD
jgi:hypothetical protein